MDSKSDPVIFLTTSNPAGDATFWRPATRATQRPCQPCLQLPVFPRVHFLDCELACFVCTVQIKVVSIFTLAVPAPQQRRQSRSSGSVCQCPIGHSTPRLLNEPSPPSQPCRRCGGCGAASPISESLAIALTLRWLNCPCQFSSLQLTGSLKTSSLQPSNSASNRLQ